MISTRKKFIFIHVPKTGGNSIQHVLFPYADDKKTQDNPFQDGIERFGLSNAFKLSKHATLKEYKKALPPSIYDSYYKFSCIRNPWERVVSYYFSPHRGGVIWERNKFLGFLDSIPPVRFFTQLGESGELGCDLDCLMRFEELESELKGICRILGINFGTIPTLNASNRRHYTQYYDQELVEKVALLFADEIKFGNYEYGK